MLFHLDMTCTIQRASEAEDGYGNEQRTFSDHATGVALRLITRTEDVNDEVIGQMITSTRYAGLMHPNQDVIGGDRITAVVDRDGSSWPGDFEVAAIVPHRGQMLRLKSLKLEKVA